MKIYLPLSCILTFIILTAVKIRSTIVVSDHWPKLKVLTFEYRPFVWKEPTNGRWIGFSIDVLDAIARKVGFTYRYSYSLVESNLELNLNIVENFDWRSRSAFNNWKHQQTDSTSTKLIDLTEPILTHNHLSVLISRWTARALNLCTLEDFLKAAESKYIEIGILSDYRYFLYLKNNNSNNSSIIERLVNVTTNHLSMITPNATFAFEESKSRTIGFLTEGHKAEYLAGSDCSFTILPDSQSLLPRETVIPLYKGLPYLNGFNEAIQELHLDGTIRRLRKKYWDTTTRCSEPVYHCTRSIL